MVINQKKSQVDPLDEVVTPTPEKEIITAKKKQCKKRKTLVSR